MSAATALQQPEPDQPTGQHPMPEHRHSGSRRLAVRPAPTREPPFDDELPQRHLSLVGPLDQPLPFGAEDLSTPSRLRLAPVPDPFAAQPTGRNALPDPGAHARRLVIGLIEAGTGRRPVSQLSRHLSPRVLTGLSRDAGRISRLGTASRPATVHSLHVGEPADGVAEVVAVIRVGDRFRAIALRLEGLDGRWRCVRLQVG